MPAAKEALAMAKEYDAMVARSPRRFRYGEGLAAWLLSPSESVIRAIHHRRVLMNVVVLFCQAMEVNLLSGQYMYLISVRGGVSSLHHNSSASDLIKKSIQTNLYSTTLQILSQAENSSDMSSVGNLLVLEFGVPAKFCLLVTDRF